MGIDKHSAIPYYRQLADILAKQIEEGVYEEKEQIPSETYLSGQYGLNRHTVRQAVNELTKRGTLYKLKGKGTFVAGSSFNSVQYKLARQSRFSHNIMEMGLVPGAKILKTSEVEAPGPAAEILELKPGSKVVIIELVRYVNDEPFCAVTSYFPAARLPGLAEKLKDFTSLYRVIENEYGILPCRVRSTFHASFSSPEDTAVLNIPLDTPILRVDSVMKTESGIPIQYDSVRYRCDRGKIIVDF